MIKKILLAIPVADFVCNETVESLYNLVIPSNVKVDMKILHSYNLSEGRTNLVKHALNNDYDYIFFVDSDMVLPKHALYDLFYADKTIINGISCRKNIQTITSDNPWTTVYRHDPSGMAKYNFGPFWVANNEIPIGAVVPVDCAGLACSLIKLDIFKNELKDVEWFKFANERSEIKWAPYCIGEDMWFFRECLKKDIQPYAHGSVRCGHIGKFTYKLPDPK